MKRAPLKISLAVIVLAGAVTFASTRFDFLQGSLPGRATGKPAPEFTGIARWINSEPITMASLRGKVVWIDFWTYSCINCIRTLPAVRAMYARYKKFGFEVIGVHSPEFDFEESEQNVRAAIERHRVPYPVAMDNSMATWRAYDNNYWPRVYIVDAKGTIRFDKIGEGGEEQLQDQVRALLEENGARLPDPIDFDLETARAHITPEIYAGYLRGEGYLGNRTSFPREQTVTYDAPTDDQLERAGTDGTFFLAGKWTAREEYSEAAEDGARVIVRLRASRVFIVAAPASASGSASVQLSVDGKPVPAGSLAVDAPNGTVTVDREDLYRLLAFDRAETHVLTLTASAGFRLYTFTFG